MSNSDALPWRVSNNIAAWYAVASSAELKEGEVRPAQLAGREIVIFRDQGKVRALDPYCAHMGAKLCNGKVEKGHLVCPLHGWQYRSDGKVAGGTQSVATWPVQEQMGAILVFNGPEALYAPPVDEPGLHWGSLKPETIDVPWFALTANAFDTHHYEAVHRRKLSEPPRIEQPDRWTFSCSYISEVTGSELSDKLMQWLSGDRIKVSMTCYGGSLFTVKSRVGKRTASLLVGLQSVGDQTTLRIFVGSEGRGLAALFSRYLYTEFMKRDLQPMSGVRLQPFTGLEVDATIERFARYLENLPVAR